MHELVKIAMRGPRQAAMLACISVLIPMMFWFGAAIIGLTTLRKGLSQGANVFVWTAIPAFGWWFTMQDPGALIVLFSVLLMAGILRYTVSWQSALVAGGVISLVTGILAPHIMPELVETLMEMSDHIFQKLAEESQQEYDAELREAFRSMMIASFAASFYGMAIGSLFLARSWQSQLFNPGGWKQEFHQMRLSPRFVMGLLLYVVVSPAIGIDPALVMMVAAMPVMVCGLALVHGLLAKKQMGGQWLFGFYLSAVMLFPTVLILLLVLAMLDSLVNFRGRTQAL
jgi:hypothetical protein